MLHFLSRHWEVILLTILLTYFAIHIIYAFARGYLP